MFKAVVRIGSATRPWGVTAQNGGSATISVWRSFSTSLPVFQEDDLVRKQLFEAVKASDKTTTKIDDSLFDVLNNLDTKPIINDDAQDDFGFGKISETHPRDIAKNIRITGPLAGRTIDVYSGGVGYGVTSIASLVRQNKIRNLQKDQARFIPPAKYRKQQKRHWWRKRFLVGFKDLLAKVGDARRRGY